MDRINQIKKIDGESVKFDVSESANETSLGGYHTANESNDSIYTSFVDDNIETPKNKHTGKLNTDIFGSTISEFKDVTQITPFSCREQNRFSFDKTIDAANILSGGINIFEDNDNSLEADNLVIDDKIVETTEEKLISDESKSQTDNEEISLDNTSCSIQVKQTEQRKSVDSTPRICEEVTHQENFNIKMKEKSKCTPLFNDSTGFSKLKEPVTQKVIVEDIESGIELNTNNIPCETIETEDSTNEVVLQIDGKNVDAIDIGNGLYLYRKVENDELTAIQILPSEDTQQPQFKFLKVRQNTEGNLEVYEEQILEVPLTNEELEEANLKQRPKSMNKCSLKEDEKSNINKIEHRANIKESVKRDNKCSFNRAESPIFKTALIGNFSTNNKSLTKTLINRHLPINKSPEVTSTNKNTKEVLTFNTGNLISNSSKTSCASGINLDSKSHSYDNKKAKETNKNLNSTNECSALMPFKPYIPPIEQLLSSSHKHHDSVQKTEKNIDYSTLKNNKPNEASISALKTVKSSVTKNYEKKLKMQNTTTDFKRNIISNSIVKSEKMELNPAYVSPPRIYSKESTVKVNQKEDDSQCKATTSAVTQTKSNSSFLSEERLLNFKMEHENLTKIECSTKLSTPDKKNANNEGESPISLGSKVIVDPILKREEKVPSLKNNSQSERKPLEKITKVQKCNPGSEIQNNNDLRSSQNIKEIDDKNIDLQMNSPVIENKFVNNYINDALGIKTLSNRTLQSIKTNTDIKINDEDRDTKMNTAINQVENFKENKPASSDFNKVQELIDKTIDEMIVDCLVSSNDRKSVVKIKTDIKSDETNVVMQKKYSKCVEISEEVIEHVPITGDVPSTSQTTKEQSDVSPEAINAIIKSPLINEPYLQQLKTILPYSTRNNINLLKPNIAKNAILDYSKKIINPKNEDTKNVLNKKFQPTKFQKAYQTALTEKRNKEYNSPEKDSRIPIQRSLHIIEADNVKSNFTQNPPIFHAPIKKDVVPKPVNTVKHQRKQLLTPAESEVVEVFYESTTNKKISEPCKAYALTSMFEKPKEKVTSVPSKKNYLLAKASTDLSQGSSCPDTPKRGRGRPRKETIQTNKDNLPKEIKYSPVVSNEREYNNRQSLSKDIENDPDQPIVLENWTIGKIDKNIICPICSKLFRSQDVLIKHVQHCNAVTRTSSKRRYSPTRSIETVSRDSSQDLSSDSNVEITEEPMKKVAIIENKYENAGVEEIIQTEAVKKIPALKASVTEGELKKPPNINQQTNALSLICDICNKSFKQASFLITHKATHKNNIAKKTITINNEPSMLVCEICNKGFRKLHHLVQHRELHSEHSKTNLIEKKVSKCDLIKTQDNAPVVSDNNTAGFRCEACGKSFRKLYHLVEHRETHDYVNRNKTASSEQQPSNIEDTPNCEICGKKFRKLYHLIEHRETHENRNIEEKKIVLPKDIIHECKVCYMVFPNEFSLNKHNVNCQKRKKVSLQSNVEKIKLIDTDKCQTDKLDNSDDDEIKLSEIKSNLDESLAKEEIDKKIVVKDETKLELNPKPISLKRSSKEIGVKGSPTKVSKLSIQQKQPLKRISLDRVTKSNLPTKKPNNILCDFIENDDEVRYMINPMYDEGEKEIFFNIASPKKNLTPRARKTSIVASKKTLPLKSVTKTISNNLLSKSNLKSASKVTRKIAESGSDESEIKYSFPKTKNDFKLPTTIKKARETISVCNRRKSLTGLSKRKSLGLAITKQTTDKKKTVSDHRCDCGQKFSCEALLVRHTATAHTPPRIRKNRTPDDSIVSSPNNKNITHIVNSVKKSALKKKVPHTGVPNTDKMKKLYSKLKI